MSLSLKVVPHSRLQASSERDRAPYAVRKRAGRTTTSASPEHLPGARAGRFAVAPDDGAVDDHGVDALGRCDGLLEARAFGDFVRVEDRDVGRHAGGEHAAVGEAEGP